MDAEELLKLLQQDLGDDDDEIEEFDDFRDHLRPVTSLEDENNGDWDLLMQSTMEVNLQLENVRVTVEDSLPILSHNKTDALIIPEYPASCEIESVPSEHHEFSLEERNEISNLMTEILDAVERSAPIVQYLPLQQIDYSIDFEQLPKEFIEEEYHGNVNSSVNAVVLTDSLINDNQQMSKLIENDIHLEEIKLLEAEEEAKAVIERDAQIRLERKQKREEEMARILVQMRKANAAVSIQQIVRRRIALNIYRRLLHAKAIEDEARRIAIAEANRLEAEAAELRRLEALRIQAEKEQKRADKFIASREGVSMMMEDALSYELREIGVAHAEIIDMNYEDDISKAVREIWKGVDSRKDNERRQIKEMKNMQQLNKLAFENALQSRIQEFRSIWTPKSANKATAEPCLSSSTTKRTSGGNGWGGSIGSSTTLLMNQSHNANCMNNSNSNTMSCQFGESKFAADKVHTATNRCLSELCEPLSVIQSQWQTLIANCMTSVGSTNSSTSSIPNIDLCSGVNDSSQTSRHSRIRLDPLEVGYRQWIQLARQIQLSSRCNASSNENSEIDQQGDSAFLIKPPNQETATGSNDELHRIQSDLGLSLQEIGKLEKLQQSVEGINSTQFLMYFHSLKDLELNVNKLSTLNGLQQLTKLEHLSVKDNQLEDLRGLKRILGLRSLKLDTNRIVDINGIDNKPLLAILSLTGNELTSFPILNCPKLQRLELYRNHISVVQENSLRDLPSLTHLDLGRNKLDHIPSHALSACQLLQTLILSQNMLTVLPAPLFLPQLRHLWVSGNRIGDMATWIPHVKTAVHNDDDDNDSVIDKDSQISCPVFLPMLEKLHLQDNAIENINIGVFCTMPLLNYLDVSFNNIANKASLIGLSIGLTPYSLKSLQLQDNPITRTTDPTRVLNDNEVSQKLNDLYQWIQVACPGLQTLSGNPFTGIFSQSTTNISLNATADIHGDGQSYQAESIASEVNHKYSLSNFRKTGNWSSCNTSKAVLLPAPSSLCDFPTTSNNSTDVGFGYESMRRQSDVATDAVWDALDEYRNQDIFSDIISTFSAKSATEQRNLIRDRLSTLQNYSHRSLQILHLLNTMVIEQNTWKAREKYQLQQSKVTLRASNDKQLVANFGDDLFWEDKIVDVLQKQLNCLLANKFDDISPCADNHGDDDDDNDGMTHHDEYFISHSALLPSTQLANAKDALLPESTNITPKVPGKEGQNENTAQCLASHVDTSSLASSSNSEPMEEVNVASSMDRPHRGENYPHSPEPRISHIHPVISKLAATSVQRIYRGSRTRRLLTQALDSAKYLDEELDNMLMKDHLESLQEMGLEDLLQAEEFDPKWIYKRSNLSRQRQWRDEGALEALQDDGDDDDESDLNADGDGSSLVYGDLQRGRRRSKDNTNEYTLSEHSSVPITKAWDESHQSHHSMRANHYPENMHIHVGGSQFAMTPRDDSSRPMSTSTDISSVSAGSGFGRLSRIDGDLPRASAESHSNDMNSHATPSNRLHSGNMSESGSKAADKVAEEWGIKDPHLIQVLLKRNKRMKQFATAKENREREKNPEVRLQKFLKSASSRSSNSNTAIQTSGSFGGRPRGILKRGGGNGGGGRGRGSSHGGRGLPSSWISGYRDQHQEDEQHDITEEDQDEDNENY